MMGIPRLGSRPSPTWKSNQQHHNNNSSNFTVNFFTSSLQDGLNFALNFFTSSRQDSLDPITTNGQTADIRAF
jgi:hypothetical protein